jgi:signal transduction histidine kinase
MVELLDKVYATGESQTVLDMPLAKLRPGSPRYVTLAYQAYREQGRIVGVAAFIYDVTDQVLAREQVQALNEELAAINEEVQAANAALHDTNARLTRTNADLDTFVYSASHDLKSPITNIEGLLTALRERLPATVLADSLVPRLLGMMDGAVARFQQTLDHLTDISRLQELVLQQPAEAIDLPALVENVRLDILPELTAAGAMLTVDLSECSAFHFSPKNLRSIVYNLLSNAVKYRAPDRPPHVALRCVRVSGQVVLTVQDNGLGLSATQQAELFQMFRRLHSHVPGSGVGLYMVKKMVENAGGTITVQSEPGVGSTFTVALPRMR